MTVTTVGLSELKAHLSKYIGQVKTGDEVIVTERGKPVARIAPIEEPNESLEAKLLSLRERGLLHWEGDSLPKKLEPRHPTVELTGDKTAAELLLEDRR
ncbi:MAG: type II toxin-antitoxin system prevent-host-death family antitoxin [Chloroflexi bacterium]|nr:type II toxin-antitoxin system prevent-host-death family antitoxin [Chloroflexota bacterium]